MSDYGRRPLGSWNRDRDKPHSIPGVESLRLTSKDAIGAMMRSVAGELFKWDLSSPRFETMREMSLDSMPERTLYDHGQAVIVEYGDDLHILPAVPEGVNIYGEPLSWRVQCDAASGRVYDDLIQRRWTSEDSVLIRNDVLGRPDRVVIDGLLAQMADCELSISQMQLLAGNPIAFYVSQDQLLTAKNMYLAMAERVPSIFVSPLAQDGKPDVLDIGKGIDPGIFDIFDHWMSDALNFLGIATTEITKRAQQTVGEIESGTDKAMARRAEKLRMREWACERAKKVFGVEMSVSLTEIGETEEVEEDDSDSAAGGDQEVAERGRRRVPERRTAFLRLAALPFPERDEGSHRGALRRDLHVQDDQRRDRGEVAGAPEPSVP